MKPIVLSDQPWPGVARTLWIVADGIRYRLFRSAVTVAVIAVAVAFLMNILSESLIKRAVAGATRARLAESRLALDWASRITVPAHAAAWLAEWAARDADDPRLREAAAFGGLGDAEAQALRDAAREAARHLAFLSALDYARRRRLVATAEGPAVFDRLSEAGALDAFLEQLRRMGLSRSLGDAVAFRTFVAAWPANRARLDRIVGGHAAAIARVEAARRGRGALDALGDAGGAFGEALREAGFLLDGAAAAELARQARVALDVRRVEASLERRATRQAVARRLDILPGDVNLPMIWSFVRRPGHAEEYLRAMREAGDDTAGLDAARLADLSKHWTTSRRLARAERLTLDIGGGWLGLGERMSWLLAVSMLVCGIGIANAMLMTVTERFREIATLKCLGALDGFILLMFVLESILMGVVGGALGAAAGTLLGAARMAVAFGPGLAGAVRGADLLLGAAQSVGVGVALAAVAAVYPSFRAARLAPMEAMRVE
jgi:putative ABC transport system permease protein